MEARLCPKIVLTVALLGLFASFAAAQSLLYQLDSTTPDDAGQFGFSVSGVPDLNGDGVYDLIIGAPTEGAAGRAHIIDGATGDEIYNVPANPGSIQFGFEVVGLPDIDGDRLGDWAVQSRSTTLHSVLIFNGNSGDLLDTLQSPNDPLGLFGYRMTPVADLNDDRVPEILVGASTEDVGQGTDVGRAYLFSGATTSPLATLGSPHKQEGGHFGFGVASGDASTSLREGLHFIRRHRQGAAYAGLA